VGHDFSTTAYVWANHVHVKVLESVAVKAGALFKGFGAQVTFSRSAGWQCVCVAPARTTDLPSATGSTPAQQRHAGGVQVHADTVHAVFDHVTRTRQIDWIHISWYWLTPMDRVNLHQLGQRVL
jgi:hypothetical protein